jgi:hypothetical protein
MYSFFGKFFFSGVARFASWLFLSISVLRRKLMKKSVYFLILPVFFVLFFVSCSSMGAPEPSYDSFSYRQNDFTQTDLAISGEGLTQEQIASILATQFPPENTVSLAIIFLYGYNNNDDKELSYFIMDESRNIQNVEKFVPIPRIFIPRTLTFDVIQDLGIRSLCEYTLIFYTNANDSMTFREWIQGELTFESDIEFSLIDNQTTAIIASDRLYSSMKKKRNLADGDAVVIAEAAEEIYTLQAQLLSEKLNALFAK